MKIRVMMTAWAVLELAAQLKGEEKIGHQSSRVDVYLHFRYYEAALALGHAESIASAMLSQTGVDVRWRSGSPKNNHGFETILIDFTSDTPQSLVPGALGSAQIHDGHIRIFWDRINATSDSGLIAPLLAHVLAHEITHILQGCPHHSQTGVMKARWTLHDVVAMSKKPLPFEPQHVELIHSGLAHHPSLRSCYSVHRVRTA